LGETQICGQPQTIVVFGLHNLGLLLSLDAQPTGFAMDADPIAGADFDNPPEQIPYLGDRLTTQPENLGVAAQPSLEKLTAIAPDLIVGVDYSADTYSLLSQIAPTVLTGDPEIKDQWQTNLQAVAQALDKEEQATTLIAQHAAKIAATRTALADAVSTYPQLLVIGASDLSRGFFAIGGDSYLGGILEAIGFELVHPPAATGQIGAPISLEALPDLDEADSIILLGYSRDLQTLTAAIQTKSANQSVEERLETQQLQDIRAKWQENPITQSLTTSQEDRVYFATYARWSLLNNPLGIDLILEQLQQFFAND
ncbi:MAG: ABC transporter substrate-binding protein, partial [Leptolyngbya sp. SIO4C5]|nr:ABC transporter substrate-binding protein [Leptolyngbya sp. SIO4C5]